MEYQYVTTDGALSELRVALGFIIIGSVMATRFWRVLPVNHPTRVFMEGRATRTRQAVKGTLSPCCPRTWLLVLAAAAIVLAILTSMDVLSHALQIDPFEGLLVKNEPHFQHIGNMPMTPR